MQFCLSFTRHQSRQTVKPHYLKTVNKYFGIKMAGLQGVNRSQYDESRIECSQTTWKNLKISFCPWCLSVDSCWRHFGIYFLSAYNNWLASFYTCFYPTWYAHETIHNTQYTIHTWRIYIWRYIINQSANLVIYLSIYPHLLWNKVIHLGTNLIKKFQKNPYQKLSLPMF